MIFNKLQMENIRSYQRETINFPRGTSLFEGDVGSGKSTILMAMEFALFGLGNQRGDALLRKGSKKGSVLLSFSVGEKDYQIKRTLIRSDKDTIRQDKAILGVNGKKIQLSPSEIKERILDILNFKEPPNPRAQSVIFRYAVYTPQEEMKFILSQKPDLRLQTLRKAFGIEDYKIAAENATLISKSIKDRINYLSGQISDLNDKRNSLTELKEKLADNENNLQKFKENKEELGAVLANQKEELEDLKETESELKQIEKEIPHLERQIADKKNLSSKYNAEIQSAEQENHERLMPELDKLEKVEKPTDISQEKLRKKIDQIKKAIKNRGELVTKLTLFKENKHEMKEKLQEWKDKNLDELNKENEKLTHKLGEYKKLLSSHEDQLQIILKKIYKLEAQKDDVNKKLKNLDGLGELCPICGSSLDNAHKKDLKQERDKEIRKFNSEINILNEVKSKGEKEIEQDKTNIRQLEKDLKEYGSLIEKFNELHKVKSKINTVEENLSSIDEKLSLNIEESVKFTNFDQYINHLENLLDRLKEYNQAQETLKNIRYQFNKNLDKVTENKASVETLKGEIDKLSENLSAFKDKIKHMPEVVEKTGELQFLYEKTNEEYRSVNEKIVSTSTRIESLTQDVANLTDEIKEKEKLHKQLDKLKDYHIWLNDYLIPTLSLIEKHVMQNIHQEFDENFKKWFNLLIDDPSKTGKIDEEFTPIIEQDGFQQEINYLSGGEKTSVALAYRLALNNIVQKVSTGMKSNLLIMDEPTDGFSKEQLYKIRDIFNELNYPQIIIVSHERELESFANNVFQIVKVDGVSEISQVN
ncbi:MAG TPA: SMC family ATPase [Methanobacterium sp.]